MNVYPSDAELLEELRKAPRGGAVIPSVKVEYPKVPPTVRLAQWVLKYFSGELEMAEQCAEARRVILEYLKEIGK